MIESKKVRTSETIASDIIISNSNNKFLSYEARIRLLEDEVNLIKNKRKEG